MSKLPSSDRNFTFGGKSLVDLETIFIYQATDQLINERLAKILLIDGVIICV